MARPDSVTALAAWPARWVVMLAVTYGMAAIGGCAWNSWMRDLVPDISLRTTFITGHPGETPKDFGELYDFVEWVEFDQMGAFVYSPEEFTPASKMDDTPTRRTAERRRAKLMELQQQISRARNEARVGRTFEAMVTGVCDETEHLLEGRLVGQAPEIDGRLLINDGIELLPKSLPAFARVGTPYAQSLSATAGTPPFTFALTGGALPAGLALSPAGAITGTPTNAGTSLFTVQISRYPDWVDSNASLRPSGEK